MNMKELTENVGAEGAMVKRRSQREGCRKNCITQCEKEGTEGKTQEF